jgi:hypothetical protein
MMYTKLRPGDLVVVRSREEILSTLDADGSLEGMLFMPEMLQYCGRRFQVYKRAHKSCDYTTPYPFLSRRIHRTVVLETRCDGSAHGGCEAGCTLLWKEAWLRPVDREGQVLGPAPAQEAYPTRNGARCDESILWDRTQAPDPTDHLPRYFCQATEITKASDPLAWWDVRQYLEDFSSGNVPLRRLLAGLLYSCYFHLSVAGIGLGRATRWLYNSFRWVWGGTKWPRTPGLIPEGMPTPAASLNLQPGQMVRVKPHDEILKTVTTNNKNRGMFWDAELVPYCGETHKVLRRVTKLIIEQTGKMVEMKTPCIILEGVICQARYSSCRMFCPRAMYPYWREIWLDRVDAEDSAEEKLEPRDADKGKMRDINA